MLKSILQARTVIITGQSRKLLDQIVEGDKIKRYDVENLKFKKKRSWSVRVTRYFRVFGTEILRKHVTKGQLKKEIKLTMKNNEDDLLAIFYGRGTVKPEQTAYFIPG